MKKIIKSGIFIPVLFFFIIFSGCPLSQRVEISEISWKYNDAAVDFEITFAESLSADEIKDLSYYLEILDSAGNILETLSIASYGISLDIGKNNSLAFNSVYYYRVVDALSNVIFDEAQVFTGIIFDRIVDYVPGDGVSSLYSDPLKGINGIYSQGIGSGSLDVVSLGISDLQDGTALADQIASVSKGYIILELQGKKVVNGSGYDFVVCENVFSYLMDSAYQYYQRHLEPAIISVSYDGVNWAVFEPQTREKPDTYDTDYPDFTWERDIRKYGEFFNGAAFNLPGEFTVFKSYIAGVADSFINFTDSTLSEILDDYVLYNGDYYLNGNRFDLDDLDPDYACNDAGVVSYIKTNGIRYIRIIDAGDFIDDGLLESSYNSGFDLDGVMVLNWEEND